MQNPYTWLDDSLATIRRANWYRAVKTVDGLPGGTICLDGREMVNFASNDYLGLAGDERLIAAAVEAIQTLGAGSTGSRLLSGHRKLHRDLENAIAYLKGTDDAVVFSSGYLANLGTITAVVGKRDLVLSDAYNHSSLKNGAILSGAQVREYPHVDMDGLRGLLQEHRNHYRRCLIITDSVFSMDGDLCPLPEILDLADEFGCMVLVDEAHGTGVFGENGSGCVEYFGCRGRELIQMGTLSKAIASLGGYVAGSSALIDFLRNRAPSWIYTTALSPGDTAAALAAIQIIQSEPHRRQKLWQNIDYCQELLQKNLLNHQECGGWQYGNVTQKGISNPKSIDARSGSSRRAIPNPKLYRLSVLPSSSPIICIQLPHPQAALEMSQYLADSGFFAPAIRPPTVPTSRIRISLMATHTRDQIKGFVEYLGNWQ